jgi:hypothetical protein
LLLNRKSRRGQSFLPDPKNPAAVVAAVIGDDNPA